jgi:protein O-GlcNAc transferase
VARTAGAFAMTVSSDPSRSVVLPTPSLAEAVNAWRAGAHDEALRQCAELLAGNARDADALHLAGVIHLTRDRQTARKLLNEALAVRETPNALVSLAQTYDAADSGAAQAALQRALALDPGHVEAGNDLGAVLMRAGRHEEAESAFRQAIASAPSHARAHYNLGLLLQAQSRPGEAEAALRLALDHQPQFAKAWNALGNLLHEQGRSDEAEAALRRAIAAAPDDADALNNLGGLLAAAGRHAEAQPLIERALALRPGFTEAWCNLGNIFAQTERNGEAIDAWQRAVDLDPGLSHTLVLLAGLHMQASEMQTSLNLMRRAVAADPANESAHCDLAYATMFATDDGAAIRAEAERFSCQHEAPFLGAVVRHANTPAASRRLRVGYVSPDFRNHCQSLFTLPLFAHHDHQAFEIVCYSSVEAPDVITQRIAGHVDLWRDVRTLDDTTLAQQIRDDGVDILVDLTMHMAKARRRLFAMRPAPVQVAWLAYPGTTGSPAIGWRLTDAQLDPPGVPGVDEQYTERSLRLPDTFWCYAPFDEVARSVEISPLPARAAGHITFGCLNNPCKLTDATLALWSPVFAALPDAKLILMATPGTMRERLETRLAAHGIDPARVRFVGFQRLVDYLGTYAQIDIALDTFPYNGHTTSLDAFWMGVPVPTRAGRVAASRAGLSLLANLGLPELAAHDDAGYARIVVELARDLPRLAALRANLRERMVASPLMDGPRFARGMEAAYRSMWRAWCEEAPERAV